MSENEKRRKWNEILSKGYITLNDARDFNNLQFIQSPRFTASVAAMQGLLASGKDGSNSISYIVDRAITYAEELLNQLNKKEK